MGDLKFVCILEYFITLSRRFGYHLGPALFLSSFIYFSAHYGRILPFESILNTHYTYFSF